MKRLLYLAICLPLAWLTACDVHEFPDDFGTPSTMEVRIMADINFLTPFEDVHEITRAGAAGTENAAGPARLIVEAYTDNHPGGELYPSDLSLIHI